MKKTIILLLAISMALAAVVTGCGGDKKANGGDTEKMTITVSYPAADETWQNDDYYKYITDKLGISVEFKSLSKDSAAEKSRILISSGSMTDIVYSGFQLDEYLKYVEQGMVRALPDGWEEKYPNVAFSMEMSGILNLMKEESDGKIYSLVRATDHYKAHINEFRAAFAEGKDLRELMKENKYRYIDDYGFVYRKDWAEKLNIKTDYIMDYEAFLDMARKFKEADLGGVGEDNVVGIAMDHTEAPNFFITAHNSSYKYIHKDESGKYVCGLLEDSTTEGVKEYADAFKEGILAPDFYTQKSQDLNSLFCSERSGIIFPRASLHYLRTLNSEFEKANPGLKASNCIGVCWVLSPDGKIHGRESGNYYGTYYFDPDMEDEKMEKILELANYVASPEGGPQVRLGVPDVDYKKEGDEYIVTREANADGVLEGLGEKYPSYEFFRLFLNPWYDYSVDIDPYASEQVEKLREAKLEHELSLLDWDERRDLYTADDYVKFNAAYEVNGLFAEIVVAEGDVVENWNKKKAEIAEAAKPVVDNMNAALVK